MPKLFYIDERDPEGILEPKFTPRDVTINRNVDAKDVYELIAEVGRGKFGTVYKCQEKATGLELAAKFVPIPKREDRRNVEREVEIMNCLQHHLIIQLYAAYEYQKMMCVVLELVEGGELFDRVIDDDFVLTEKACTVFIRQVCEAMQFIHRNNILHLDLKPENILCLTKEGNRIKIIDFGLARRYDPDKRLQVLFGTPEFVAPEVVNFDSISFGTDMWSVGVICYVLLSGLSPFMGETDIETMANVTVAKYDFDDEAFTNVSAEALDFITKLLVKDMSSRMSASECLDHIWLKRRLRPYITSKPVPVPTVKCKPTPTIPSPATVTIANSVIEPELNTKELETTKDNLKSFIERWEEHPNSPYIFDNGSNVISPLRGNSTDSILSSRVCSPSPCESIDSATEVNTQKDDGSSTASERMDMESTDNDNAGNKTPTLLSDKDFKSYLQSFDRRNSESSHLSGNRSTAEKLNLADEIKKLSDHLMMLSEINTKLERENTDEPTPESESNKNEIMVEKSEAATHKETYHSTYNIKRPQEKFARSQSIIDPPPQPTPNTLNKSSSVIKTWVKASPISATPEFTTESTIKIKTSNQRPVTETTQSSSLTVRLKSFEQNTKVTMNGNSEVRKPNIETSRKPTVRLQNGFKSLCTSESMNINYGVPWPVTNKRTKYRINQMSRDVPIGSPDTHQAFNLEDAANTTKDCLLHLLEKYHETRMRSDSTSARHASISVDCNVSENFEYRSMSSINAFFQRHSTSGQTVKQIREQLQSKKNNI